MCSTEWSETRGDLKSGAGICSCSRIPAKKTKNPYWFESGLWICASLIPVKEPKFFDDLLWPIKKVRYSTCNFFALLRQPIENETQLFFDRLQGFANRICR